MSSATPAATESRLRRALAAFPIIALAALMTRAMAMGEPIGPVLAGILESSRFTATGGVDVAIINEFYGIRILDEIFAHITVAFAQLQFFTDPRAYWHSLIFLTDFAAMYAVFLVESYRPANKFLLLRFPSIICFLSQLFGIGVLAPVYFYSFYIVTPSYKLMTPSAHLPGMAPCLAILPTLALGYYSSHFPSFLHSSLEARHWWNWIWQLFPVWGSLVMVILSNIMPTGNHQRANDSSAILRVLRPTVLVIGLVSTATYWYTLSQLEYPLSEILVPQYLVASPTEPEVCLRTIIQYDCICSFSAGFMWLAYQFRDLDKAGVCAVPWIRSLLVAAVLGCIFGPGTLFIGVWLLKEEVMASHRSMKKA
ncbi:hypothetical protein FZEAL_675 [Fusarium zealandicum]|uniref:Uncharacterized protein n=1 Tax=Fusarium zealandicum TaxID=1053134 RepID=A0A8H4XQ29_9HYPO|nr:hypothetical protein FZEAL_675 [Fusarium zealandicum]